MGIRRVAGLAWNRLLRRVDNSTGKGTSGMDKFSSKVHRVHMKLGGKLLISLRIETQFIERLQGVSVVEGSAHTQKDNVESNGGSLENVAKVFVLFLCGVQFGLQRPPAWHGCSTYRSQQINQSKRSTAALGLQGLQGWPTARDSGWWQLAGETNSTSVENWN